MKQSRILLLLAVFCMAISGGAAINEYTINVGDFNNLKISGNLNVIHVCSTDSSGYIRFFATPEVADAVITQNKGGSLNLGVSEEFQESNNLPTVYALSNFLTDITNSGDGIMTINGPNRTAIFKTTVVGNGTINVLGLDCMKVSASLTTGKGTINLSGRTGEFSAKLVGTGNISAAGLETPKAVVNAVGTGSVSCWATKNLAIKCLGSTKVYYKPVNGLEIKKTGGGKIIRLEEDNTETGQTAEEVIIEEDDDESIEIEDVN